MDRATKKMMDGVTINATLGTNCVRLWLDVVAVFAQMGGMRRPDRN